MDKYFEFTYMVTENGQIIAEGNGVYQAKGLPNVEEMKKAVRTKINKIDAVIAIPLFQPISKEDYLLRGGQE